jgi:hypothetical protein
MGSDLVPVFEGKHVRMVGEFTTRDGATAEMGWVLADVAAVLGMSHARELARSLDDDEVGTVSIADGTPGNPNTLAVTEPGLYKLLARSRKPEAKRFDRWVRHEILPTIRKTGGYGIGSPHGTDLVCLVGDAITQAIRPVLEPFQQQLVLQDARITVQDERITVLEDALARPAWFQVCEAHDLRPFDCWLSVNTVNKAPCLPGLYCITWRNGRILYVGQGKGERGLYGRLNGQHDAKEFLHHMREPYSIAVCPTEFAGVKLTNAERDLTAALQPDWDYGGAKEQWKKIKAALGRDDGQMSLWAA